VPALRPQLISSDFTLFISLCKGAETKFYNSERSAFRIETHVSFPVSKRKIPAKKDDFTLGSPTLKWTFV
jgi:hypothetical protein